MLAAHDLIESDQRAETRFRPTHMAPREGHQSLSFLTLLAIAAGAAGARIWPNDHRTRAIIERWMCMVRL